MRTKVRRSFLALTLLAALLTPSFRLTSPGRGTVAIQPAVALACEPSTNSCGGG
ncbi:MAG: hypothetical protein HY784_11375 [Chloroflexi bacterium]|nr:hypothetical protein [Chloroflexota bacterium]